jgi:hypothetical protein
MYQEEMPVKETSVSFNNNNNNNNSLWDIFCLKNKSNMHKIYDDDDDDDNKCNKNDIRFSTQCSPSRKSRNGFIF